MTRTLENSDLLAKRNASSSLSPLPHPACASKRIWPEAQKWKNGGYWISYYTHTIPQSRDKSLLTDWKRGYITHTQKPSDESKITVSSEDLLSSGWYGLGHIVTWMLFDVNVSLNSFPLTAPFPLSLSAHNQHYQSIDGYNVICDLMHSDIITLKNNKSIYHLKCLPYSPCPSSLFLVSVPW